MNWHKVSRRIVLYLAWIIQTIFLFMIFMETHSTVVSISVIVLSLLLLIAYIKLPLHHDEHLYEHILVAIWIPAAAMLAYYLNNGVHLGPVIAAGSVGTAASFLPALRKPSAYLKQLPPAMYCGAFIGMSSPTVAHGLLFVAAAGVFAGVLLVSSRSLFQGMGGKLGLIAFTGVVITSLLLSALSGHVAP